MRLWLAVALLVSSTALALPVNISGARAGGGTVRIDDERGRVVAITLMSRYTKDELERVNRALEPEVGADVRLVTVVDFIGIPRLFHELARSRVAAGAVDPAVQVVVDERGNWGALLGAAPDKRVDIIVLDRQGELRGHFVGLTQVDEARRLIRDLRTTR